MKDEVEASRGKVGCRIANYELHTAGTSPRCTFVVRNSLFTNHPSSFIIHPSN